MFCQLKFLKFAIPDKLPSLRSQPVMNIHIYSTMYPLTACSQLKLMYAYMYVGVATYIGNQAIHIIKQIGANGKALDLR